MSEIDKLINERQKLHGPFAEYAEVDQELKLVISPQFRELVNPAVTSGLDMIFSKVARIITGEPEELDHWVDIQGYARAVQRCLPNFKEDDNDESCEHCGLYPTPVPCEHCGLYPETNISIQILPEMPEASVSTNMDIKTYNDIDIITLDARVLAPDKVSVDFNQGELDRKKIQLACDLTMKKVDQSKSYDFKEAARQLIANLYDAEHRSVFEHCNITFLASGISRSLLAQVTRQGTFRFTSASQQYQDYRKYPMSLRPGWDENPLVSILYKQALEDGLDRYMKLVDLGELPEEARQVLPPAATVNLEITANARNLARFLRIRLCKRNVEEMEIFAHKLHVQCLEWLPELFSLIHAPCAMDGKCNQGKMACGKPFARIK